MDTASLIRAMQSIATDRATPAGARLTDLMDVLELEITCHQIGPSWPDTYVRDRVLDLHFATVALWRMVSTIDSVDSIGPAIIAAFRAFLETISRYHAPKSEGAL